MMIEWVKVFLDVCIEEVEVLLSYFSYDFEVVATAWFEDMRKVCEMLGLIDVKMRCENSEVVMLLGGMWGCGICFEDFLGDVLMTVGCAYEFCDECWLGWVMSKVNDGFFVVNMWCFMCFVKVFEFMIWKFFSDEDEMKFDIFLRRSFLENNVKLCFCIGVDCECVIVVE